MAAEGRDSVNERGHSKGVRFHGRASHGRYVGFLWQRSGERCIGGGNQEKGMGVLVVTMAKGRHSVYFQRFFGVFCFRHSRARGPGGGGGSTVFLNCTKWNGGLRTSVFELAGSQHQC